MHYFLLTERSLTAIKPQIKTTVSASLRNWSSLLCFEVIYKTLGFCLVFPLLRKLLSLIMKTAGLPFLSQENLLSVLRQPKPLLIGLCALVILALYLYLEVAAYIFYCDKGWHREHLTVLELWKGSLLRTGRVLHFRRILLLFLLPLIALSAYPIAGGFLKSVKIPEFILEFILENPLLSGIYTVALVLININLFFFQFAFPAVILENETFFQAQKDSRRYLSGNKWKSFLFLIQCFVLFLCFAGVIFLVSVLGLYAYARSQGTAGEDREVFRILYPDLSRIGRMVFTVFGSVVLSSAVVTMFHTFRGEQRPNPSRQDWRFKPMLLRTGTVAITLILVLLFTETEMAGRILGSAPAHTAIVAHRAGGYYAPENTIAALNQAIDDGADMAEIDVQQTLDQELVVMHDTNLKRVAGLDKNIWDATGAEIRTLEAGSHFSSKFAGEPLPTLTQMLRAAKDRIFLMIELKSSGHEQNLEQQTLELIRAEDMEDQCTIASMNLDILKQVKKLDPEIKTVYITALLVSDHFDIDYLDAFSVETTSLTLQMAEDAHSHDKKVYTWTANSEKNMQKIIFCEADGIITDNVPLAQYSLVSSGKNLFLEDLLGLLFP